MNLGLFKRKAKSKFGKYLIEHPEQFDEELKEVIVLTKKDPDAYRMGTERYWEEIVQIFAYVDAASGELHQTEAWLCWNLTEKEHKRKANKFDIQKEQCYRLLIRESLPRENLDGSALIPRGWNLFVVKVLERDCREDRLDAILKEFQKPVSITLKTGEILHLDRARDKFTGDIKWLQHSCELLLNVDESCATTAEIAHKAFASMNENQEEWDQKIRAFAAKKLVELANDWQQSEEYDDEEASENTITEEAFAGRIKLLKISFDESGDFEFTFSDDDMFYGHWVVVSGNPVSGFEDANIEG